MLLPVELTEAERERVKPYQPGPEPALSEVRWPDGRMGSLPVSAPRLVGHERDYVLQCLDSNWISSQGGFVPRFESAFATKVGCTHGVACSSGTTALHVALAALGLRPGDEVIVPSFTMVAVANCVSHLGARPVFAEIDRESLTLLPGEVARLANERTRGVIVVHTYGHPADMDPLLHEARSRGLWILEDAAEAHGALYRERPAGSLADAAVFSFYANKIITTGEGGMVTTSNAALAETIRTLRDHAFSTERHFWHRFRGFNFRMTNLQAAIGLGQTEAFDQLVEERRQHQEWYREALHGVSGLSLIGEKPWAHSVFWMHAIVLDESIAPLRDVLRNRLAEQGIETRTFFVPLHLQPAYLRDHADVVLPVTESFSRRGLYLPSGAGLTQEQIQVVSGRVREFMAERFHG